ncbi:hypothetical protein Tco_0793989 [Tanacetum coccineum]
MSMWIISRGVVLLILLMEYKVLKDSFLHRSSINNRASLSNKFGGFYFSFKFGITGLLHHVITTIAERIRGGQGSEVNDGVNGVPDFSTIIAHQLQNLLPTIVSQVGDQGRGQGNVRIQNGDAVNDNIRGDFSRCCTDKEFLACNPKEYDGKGGAIVYTRWIEKMESVQDMSGCRDSQKVKYTAGSFVGKAITWWNSQIHIRGREAVVGFMSWLATEPKTIQKVVQIVGTLTDEALRNGSIKKDTEKRGNGGEPKKDRNVRDDNSRTRTGNVFVTTTNPVGRENTGKDNKDKKKQNQSKTDKETEKTR